MEDGTAIPWWFCPMCPLADSCNEANFKKWKVWGWTPEECRAQVALHLTKSGLHACTRQEAQDFAAICEVEQSFHHEELSNKRPKGDKGTGKHNGKDTSGKQEVCSDDGEEAKV
jgi:hypothetical protein